MNVLQGKIQLKFPFDMSWFVTPDLLVQKIATKNKANTFKQNIIAWNDPFPKWKAANHNCTLSHLRPFCTTPGKVRPNSVSCSEQEWFDYLLPDLSLGLDLLPHMDRIRWAELWPWFRKTPCKRPHDRGQSQAVKLACSYTYLSLQEG